MNEQDKQACKDAKLQNLVDLKPLTFDTGWQAALEYARGKQEPVAFVDANGDLIAKVKLEPWTDLYTTPPAQPVQPAVAQGDAVHFRAVLCSEQQNQAVSVVPKVVGFVDRKAAEQFILEKRDFQGWKYNLESLYTTPPAVAINEQMLEALKLIVECGSDGLPVRTFQQREKIAKDAIAAAEAAKGGVV